MKIDRMMTIIVTLLNRKRVTAKELADKFEVSVRTIYRDIDAIDRAGIPIISYAGNNGGFGIMENYKLSHQLLTPTNLSALLTALQGINNTFEDIELESSIEKLRNLIPKDQTHHLDLNMEQIIISMPAWANTSKEKQLLKDIRNAMTRSLMITVDYRNYMNEISSRQLEPMSIVFKGYTWHLFAYCHLKKDYRVFKISRMLSLKTDDISYERREKSYFEIEEALKDQNTSSKITLKFDSKVRMRVEDIFAKDNIQVLDSGEMIVTAEYPDKEWYLSLILSFGEHIEVLAPEHIRKTVADRVRSMYEKYK